MPRNVRFAHNLFAGQTPDLKIVRADEVLPGLLFLDNEWAFSDKKSLSSVPYEEVREGFKPVDMPDGLNQEEKERIDACIFTVGPTWYKALKENVNHIDTNR